jgi:hypothetical protein
MKEICNLENFLFWESRIDDSLVESLEIILETEKCNENGFYSGSCTVNGFQTYSIHENEIYKPLLNTLLSYTPNKKLLYYRWFHLIDYNKFGKQDKHDHKNTEDYSFIIYLNTCDKGGETIFEVPNRPLFMSKPVRGKLLFFPAYLQHWAENVYENKKVAVGALNIIKEKK